MIAGQFLPRGQTVVVTKDRVTTDRSRTMSRRGKPQTGTVYLIHFETRLKHAGH